MHDNNHPLAGKRVKLNENAKDPAHEVVPGTAFVIEDWWDHLTGGSWMNANGNFAAMKYAMRAGMTGMDVDDEVVYGKISGLGHLVHVSELGDVYPCEDCGRDDGRHDKSCPLAKLGVIS